MPGTNNIPLKQSILVWGIGDIYFILAVMVSVLFAVLAPDIQHQLKLNNADLGLLGTAFFLSYGIAQLFTGRFFDLLGPKITLGSSAVIAAIGLFLFSGSNSFGVAIAAKIITGVGLSTSYIGAIYLADTWFEKEKFALLSGITQMSSNILTAFLVIVLALSQKLIGFRSMMLYLAIALIIMAILIFFFVRKAGPEKLKKPEKPLNFFSSIGRLLTIKQYILGTLYFSIGFGSLLALSDLWNIPRQLAYDANIKTAASLNAMLPFGTGLGALIAGWLAVYLNSSSRVAKVFILGMVCFFGILLYGPKFSIVTTFPLLFILGFFFGGAVLGFPLVEQYLPETLKGIAFGLMAMVAYLISSFLQYVVGFILTEIQEGKAVNSIHDFKVALTPIFVSLIIGLIISLWIKDNSNKKES